ncbi:peptidyl-prolyl cis-trans isomerase CYP21-1 [Citrus sinensis]|uniref:Peptidyl-prolyl cis-trans isomerase CYP21-1 n=1 Tax=Citrus sinensis TaxID=2711 RepID=A0ACB8ICL1_CITSI|nr:peptidyl-prolyl cis-trans isomerase CYP21-1 [Citrus sinensis]
MRREISGFVRTRYLLLFVLIFVFLIAAFSSRRKLERAFKFLHLFILQSALTGVDAPENEEEEKEEEVFEITHRVYLDVDIEEQRLGRIVIGLYGQVVPKTVGEKGTGASGKPLHFKGKPFHRIVSGFVIQGGDIVRGDGKGSDSIYGGTFPDENFKIKHSHAGVVSMVNSGPDSNGSQFFITTVKASWLDGEHVVFGKVIQGMDTVYAIEGGAGTYSGKPRKKVTIADSGEIPKNKWDEER